MCTFSATSATRNHEGLGSGLSIAWKKPALSVQVSREARLGDKGLLFFLSGFYQHHDTQQPINTVPSRWSQTPCRAWKRHSCLRGRKVPIICFRLSFQPTTCPFQISSLWDQRFAPYRLTLIPYYHLSAWTLPPKPYKARPPAVMGCLPISVLRSPGSTYC